MQLVLSSPRYVTKLSCLKAMQAGETLAFDAVVAAPYELLAEGYGDLRFGSIVFHRLFSTQDQCAQFAYLEPQAGDKKSEVSTFHCDIPVDESVFDRWLASGALKQKLSLSVSFGFMPPPGLKHGAGPDGWQRKIWSVATHRELIVTDCTLLVHW